jgi:hypothetical protein
MGYDFVWHERHVLKIHVGIVGAIFFDMHAKRLAGSRVWNVGLARKTGICKCPAR